jgi:hypothetical protein
MANTAFKMTALAVIGLGISAGTVRADKTQIEGKLRQELAIKLDDVTVAQALAQIGQKADVKIVLSPEAAWKLPEGEQTRLSVILEGRLVESLEKMLNSFFMRYAVGNESLTIYPRAELKHVIGRPTAGELKLLRNIYGNKMWLSADQAEPSEQFVQQAINAMAKEPVDGLSVNDIRAIGIIISRMSGGSVSASSPHEPNSLKGAPLTVASLLEEARRVYTPPRMWCVEGPRFPRGDRTNQDCQ